MKKLLPLICCMFLIATTSKAQYVNIPDSNFRSWLMKQYPSCFNGAKQMDTTCNQITSAIQFNISRVHLDTNIKDLTGVKYFKNLKYLFFIRCPKLRRVDKLPTKIVEIDFSYCSFDSLPDMPDSLEIINCKGLMSPNGSLKKIGRFLNKIKKIDCSYQSLTQLLSLPSSLQELDCSSNLIDTISFIGNNKLRLLNCSFNKIRDLGVLSDNFLNLKLLCYYALNC